LHDVPKIWRTASAAQVRRAAEGCPERAIIITHG
jgi:ferredoxin